MTNKKTRLALLLSAASILLSFAMLLGTTFAWFTDSATSGVNKIVSGILNVELYNDTTDSGSVQITGEKSTDPKFFDDVTEGRWEPGAMAIETFTIKNVGNLALKYALEFDMVASDGDVSLAGALKIATVEGTVDTVNGRIDPTDTATYKWEKFDTFVRNGDLDLSSDDEKEDTYTFILWWEPTQNDNDYNLNNNGRDDVASTAFKLNLYATQLAAEPDSFGTDYDENATYPESEESNQNTPSN